MTDACDQNRNPEFTPPRNQRFWVQDKTRLWRITNGREFAAEAVRDGFREVNFYQLEAFTAETEMAKGNGWKPDSRKPFQSFLPAFQENAQ